MSHDENNEIVNKTREPREKKIPVPTQYRQAAKILQQVTENGKSIKELVYNNKHIRQSKMMALLIKIHANESHLEQILIKTGILANEPIQPFLCRILVAELMFGIKMLNGQSKPVQCVLKYHDKLCEALDDLEDKNPVQQTKQTQHKVPRYVRMNRILIKKSEAKEYLEKEGWKYIENTFESYNDFLEAIKNLDDESYLTDYHIKEIFVFPGSSRKYWAGNEMVHEGKFLLQDKASCLPTFLLDPPHKSTVMDMCAAPGVKTTHLAAIMKNKGKIYAIERDTKRYKTLCEMLEVAKTSIVQAMNRDVLEVTDEDVPNVEYILLDPSCSGSGMLNRFESEINNKDTGRLYKLAGLQHKLLTHAMTSFPNVKKIVYSTCSVYPEENEEVILGVLRKQGNFKIVDASQLLNNKWNNYGSALYPGIAEKVIYAKTSEDLTNGFFVCVLERCADDEMNEFYLQKKQNIDGGGGKRKITKEEPMNGEEVPEDNSEKPKKQKKKWKMKNYNQ